MPAIKQIVCPEPQLYSANLQPVRAGATVTRIDLPPAPPRGSTGSAVLASPLIH